MRAIIFDDLMKLSLIVDKMGIELNLNELLNKSRSDKGTVQERVGAQVALLLFKKIHLAKTEVYDLVAGIAETTIQDVSKFGIKQFIEIFTEIISSEDIKSFFTSSATDVKQD